jgi:hypothetical protein
VTHSELLKPLREVTIIIQLACNVSYMQEKEKVMQDGVVVCSRFVFSKCLD